MRVVHNVGELSFDRNSVVTVGSFDGVHRAHQELIRHVVARARERGGRSVIVTFDPHPKQVLAPHKDQIRLLSSLEERLAICEELGVDIVVVLSFTYEFSRQSFREFYERTIVRAIGVSEVIEGYDHHFGRDREGSIQELLQMGREFDFTVTAMKPVTVNDEVVSSSAIRKHLLEGRVDRAADLLGRPYAVRGTVERGDGRGRSLGYPTANVRVADPAKLIPADGVYVTAVRWNGASHYGMANIGRRPTFGGRERKVEVHLLDFDGGLYGTRLEVKFLRRLRDEQRFDSTSALVRQLDADLAQARALIQDYEKILRASPGGAASQHS
ncbi:MAG: riboflavin biosynthesis protein [Bacteroidia bacterium]|nr:MAG: riboflavin biosynthesis protein [Bacteroidia bacterium]